MRRTVVDLDRLVAPIASRQHGLVARWQVRDVGGSDDAIRWRLRTGKWVQVFPGVYLVAGVPNTREQRLMAAMLAAGQDAVASHATSGDLHGLEGFRRAVIHLTVPRRRGPNVNGVKVHRVALRPDEITVARGFPATSCERMLLEIAPTVRRERFVLVVDEALRRQLTTYARLRAYADTDHRGDSGAVVLRAAVDELGPQGGRGESTAEERLVLAIARDGLPTAARAFPVYSGRRKIGTVDLGYPEARIAIEVGGDPWHTGLRRDRDATIRNALILDGWLLLEFTDRQVRGACRDAVVQVRSALMRRAPDLVRRRR